MLQTILMGKYVGLFVLRIYNCYVHLMPFYNLICYSYSYYLKLLHILQFTLPIVAILVKSELILLVSIELISS